MGRHSKQKKEQRAAVARRQQQKQQPKSEDTPENKVRVVDTDALTINMVWPGDKNAKQLLPIAKAFGYKWYPDIIEWNSKPRIEPGYVRCGFVAHDPGTGQLYGFVLFQACKGLQFGGMLGVTYVDEVQLTDLAVHPCVRNRGVATRLLSQVEAWGRSLEFKNIGAEAFPDVQPFYLKLGWKVHTTNYGGKESAWMRAPLK